MQYSTVFLSLLAASGAIASPSSHPDGGYSHPGHGGSITVTLRGETENPLSLHEPSRRAIRAKTQSDDVVSTVELNLGENPKNPDLRCQILDEQLKPLVVIRGLNTDVSFADGGKGPWTLREPTVVAKVVCDPAFVQIKPDDERLQVRVLLQSQSPEVGISFDLSGVVQNEVEVLEPTPFETVALFTTGELVDPKLRCQIVGEAGPIVVVRGANIDTSFSDAGKGEWTLQEETVVQKIICDPAFVAAPA